MGGVGKTQVALEYVHRFKAAYDIVWWIQSEQVQFIDGAMADLGTNIGVATNVGGPTEPTAVDIARATLQALRRGEPSERWLVVFDNAEDLDKVGEFLPKGGGHVLITSRNGAWSDRAHPIQVDVFRRHESVAHLRRRVETVSEEEANQIAEALGDLPIAVAAAGAWLAETGTPVADYLGQIERHSSQAVEATWDLSLNRLLGQSPAAYRLLQLCSVLAPEIALELLYSDEMAAALTPLDPSVSERVMRGALVQQINRLALLKLDVHAGQVQVHRLLQNVVRDRMSAADLEEARHQVHLMLAASRPRGEVDDPDTWRRFRMLWPHLQISGAVDCLDEKVRQLLIDRVRYLWRRGDLPQGEELGLDIAAAWATLLETGSDSAESESLHRQLLHLRFNVANILREQARFEEARSLDEEVLDSQRKLLGPRHPHTLMTSGSLAADLRALGRYAEALPMEDVTYRAWSEGFGEDHPRTLAALNNLAAAYRAVGNFRDARSRDQDAHERRRVVLGPTHPYTLHSASCLGRDLREAGEYEKSVTLLRSIFDAFREELGPDAAGSLNAQANLAVSLRSAGRAGEAAPLLEEAYERLNDRFGPSSSETVSCRLSRSANLLVAGDTEWATREMQAVTKAYEDSLGATHPHTLVCVSNLSAAARASGDHKRARELAEQASTGFRRTLGLDHPYTLAATMNVASCLVEDGDLARARRPMQEMATQMGKTLGPEHPDTLCCESNLAITLRKLGETGPAADDTLVLDRLAGTIGASHPAVTELREQRLVHRVLDPHPF
jgi:tetratricopeptide (TPR) repeat protein